VVSACWRVFPDLVRVDRFDAPETRPAKTA
jgi:hypothetical protein